MAIMRQSTALPVMVSVVAPEALERPADVAGKRVATEDDGADCGQEEPKSCPNSWGPWRSGNPRWHRPSAFKDDTRETELDLIGVEGVVAAKGCGSYRERPSWCKPSRRCSGDRQSQDRQLTSPT